MMSGGGCARSEADGSTVSVIVLATSLFGAVVGLGGKSIPMDVRGVRDAEGRRGCGLWAAGGGAGRLATTTTGCPVGRYMMRGTTPIPSLLSNTARMKRPRCKSLGQSARCAGQTLPCGRHWKTGSRG